MVDDQLAVALLSGGLDSAVAAAWAADAGRVVHALSIDYGQRHRSELDAAKRLAEILPIASHRVVSVDLATIGGSALTSDEEVPKSRGLSEIGRGVPNTYVPARNTVFLSIALGLAEVLGAAELVIGANSLDYSGYPDCRGPYLHAFEEMANLATAAGVEGRTHFRIWAPLLHLTKAEIVTRGVELAVPLELTHSCYDPDDSNPERSAACGRCDACLLRRKGFAEAHVPDPTPYAVQLP